MLASAAVPTTQYVPIPAPHVPTTGAPLCRALHAVANMAVDSRFAAPLAAMLGGGIGAGISLLCNGGSNVLVDGIVGAVLGAVSQQYAYDSHVSEQAHRDRWELLNCYPKTRVWLQNAGVTFADRKEVVRVHDAVQRVVQQMTDHYRGYCAERRQFCDPRAIEDITTFCTAHCADRGSYMALQPGLGRFYVAAVDEAARDELTRELQAGRLPSALFRNRGYAYMCAELVAEDGNADRRCRLDADTDGDGQWQREPASQRGGTALQPLADCYQPSAEPLVQVRYRRGTGLRPAYAGSSAQSPIPITIDVPAVHPRQAHAVTRGPVLREQCGILPSGGVTLRRLQVIESDLMEGRRPGHVAKQFGCRAVDITLAGNPGRNAWRLLYQEDGHGVQMIGIVDYHVGDARRIRWWEG